MSVNTVYFRTYTCNLCGKEEDARSYYEVEYYDDPPEGWRWFREHGEGEPIQHACPDCTHWIVDGQRSRAYFEDKIRRLRNDGQSNVETS